MPSATPSAGGESARAGWRWTIALDARGARVRDQQRGRRRRRRRRHGRVAQPVIGAESKDAWPERRRLWNEELNELRVQWRKEFEEAEAKERERLRLMQIKLEKEVAETAAAQSDPPRGGAASRGDPSGEGPEEDRTAGETRGPQAAAEDVF